MKKLMLGLFLSFLIVPGIWIAAEGLTGRAETYSDAEQRMLATFPASVTMDNLDQIGGQIETYINDHAPFRDEQVALNAKLDYQLFDSTDTPTVTLGKNGWLFYAGQNSTDDFRGLGSRSEEWHQTAANLLNGIDASLEAQGIDYLRTSTNIPIVYPKECFEDKSYQWYYKTDTHWNNAGGFLAGQELIQTLGGDPWDISQVTVGYTPRGTGDLVRLAHLPSGEFDETEAMVEGYLPETVLHMTEDTSYYPSLKFYTSENAPDPRHIVIYRDSFADAITATMARYFARVDTYWWNSGAENRMGQEKPDVVVYEILERYIDERMIDDLNKLSQVWQ